MSEIFIVVGAGHCGGQLVARLRAEHVKVNVQLIGEEPHLPYQRPPLSKAFLAGEVGLERVYLRPADFYGSADIEVTLETRVTAINPTDKTIALSFGGSFTYEKLALTTGSRIRELPLPGVELPGIFYLRNIHDSEQIRSHFKPGARLVIVGGGYIGLEVAAVASTQGVAVMVLEMEPEVMHRVVAAQVAQFYRQVHRDAGVNIRTGVKVSGFEGDGKVRQVLTADGSRFDADFVVIGVGIIPNSELASDAGLEINNGIVVDEYGQTSDPDIFAAGDCTNHPSALYGRRVRLESVHNAMAQAKAVAANMCGKRLPYAEVPWFWSDQYDLKLQIAGLSQGHDQTVIRGSPEDRTFTVFYLKEGVLVAADSVNAMQDHMVCRTLIAKKARIAPAKLADPAIPLKEVA